MGLATAVLPGLTTETVAVKVTDWPAVDGFRLEATAELQNGLAQGYLPISQGGQQVMLVQSPRALRGGLSFIF